MPPGPRPADAFDPGAKYHIPGNTPYARYFLARILQFQFYKAACDISGWKGPLHRCSFYGNKEVGKRLNTKVEFVNIPFQGPFAAVQSGQIQAAVSSITITKKRLESVSFAQPYYDSDQSLTVTKASGIKNLAGMDGKIVGVDTGSTLRLSGFGAVAPRGGPAGDLFLRVRHAAHPDFTSEEADILHELDIAPWEAVLGTEIVVPTLDGSIKLRIPAGAENGQKLRARLRGLPKGKSGERGDFYVILKVQLPSALSDEERQLWEKLRDVSTFQPRSAR